MHTLIFRSTHVRGVQAPPSNGVWVDAGPDTRISSAHDGKIDRDTLNGATVWRHGKDGNFRDNIFQPFVER